MSDDAQDPKDPQDDLLLDHRYDDIQEYDNPLPRWWVYLFYATIAYSVLYWLNVPGIGIGAGRMAAYEREVAEAKAREDAFAAAQPKVEVTDASLRALAADATALATGKDVYGRQCMPCHRPDAGGSIGPNLTDDFWIHGGRPLDVHRTIATGVLDKGMPAWSAVLTPGEVAAVTAYVLSLHGTNPKDPKAPQGVKVEAGAGEDDPHEHDHSAHPEAAGTGS